MSLRASGFTLDELGDLPLKSWIDLFGAVRAQYWDDKVAEITVAHPAKARDVQRRFVQASNASWGAGRRPFWADVRRMKRWVSRLTGVAVREQAQGEGKEAGAADAEEGRPHDGPEGAPGGPA